MPSQRQINKARPAKKDPYAAQDATLAAGSERRKTEMAGSAAKAKMAVNAQINGMGSGDIQTPAPTKTKAPAGPMHPAQTRKSLAAKMKANEEKKRKMAGY